VSFGFGGGRSGGGGRGGAGKPGAGGRGGAASGKDAGKRYFFRRRKVCKFCADKIDYVDYKDVKLLSGFVPERGKILPRRMFGTCAEHQRKLTLAIKRARNIALLPFASAD
jgi:small subunit ribosomal protein S18